MSNVVIRSAMLHYRFKHLAIALSHQCYGTVQVSEVLNYRSHIPPGFSSSGRPTHTVEILFKLIRHVVINHSFDAFDVKTTRRKISG